MQSSQSPRLEILVCCHKADYFYANEFLRPIIVGAELCDKQKLESMEKIFAANPNGGGAYKDNDGDNISALNPYFCELSAMYWAWKNLDSDYYGLFHYRRILDFRDKSLPRDNKLDVDSLEIKPHKIIDTFGLTKQNILKALNTSPIIVASPIPCPKGFEISTGLTQYEIYARDHRQRDMDIILNIIKENFPSMLESAEQTLFTRGMLLSWCNMFVMRKDLFFEYCEFVFGVLLEAHKRIDVSGYTSYQKRIYGFIAERLLNVFLLYKKFHNGIMPEYRNHWEVYLKKPFFGSVVENGTKRFYLCKIRIYKTKLETQ